MRRSSRSRVTSLPPRRTPRLRRIDVHVAVGARPVMTATDDTVEMEFTIVFTTMVSFELDDAAVIRWSGRRTVSTSVVSSSPLHNVTTSGMLRYGPHPSAFSMSPSKRESSVPLKAIIGLGIDGSQSRYRLSIIVPPRNRSPRSVPARADSWMLMSPPLERPVTKVARHRGHDAHEGVRPARRQAGVVDL